MTLMEIGKRAADTQAGGSFHAYSYTYSQSKVHRNLHIWYIYFGKYGTFIYHIFKYMVVMCCFVFILIIFYINTFSLGKGEVGSSILLSSTIFQKKNII